MNNTGKEELFDNYLERYLSADKTEKGKIIDEIEHLTDMHRKSIIRRFKREQMTPKSKKEQENRGRKVKYGPDVNYALKEVWQLANKICGERLVGNIELFVNPLKRFGEWNHKPKATELLLEMSLGTIKNRIADFRVNTKNKKDYNEEKPQGIRQVVPIRQERNYEPGSGELDTVVHSNNTKQETNVWTLNYVDIELHWVLLAAQLGKGKRRTVDNMNNFKQRLPFTLKQINIDNGSEFLNWHCKDWCDQNNIKLTRSRAYQKNDNCYVEQKNFTAIRDFLGYSNMTTRKQAQLLNQLYQQYLIDYLNFFQPTMKFIGKQKNKHHNNRLYTDQAKTPFQRVQEHSDINQETKDKLKQKLHSLNPKQLKENIDNMIKKIRKSTQNTK